MGYGGVKCSKWCTCAPIRDQWGWKVLALLSTAEGVGVGVDAEGVGVGAEDVGVGAEGVGLIIRHATFIQGDVFSSTIIFGLPSPQILHKQLIDAKANLKEARAAETKAVMQV